MRILVYRPDGESGPWADDLKAALPQAEVRIWQPGDQAGCDYAVLWAPPAELLACVGSARALFLMGAGVDALLRHGEALPAVPVVRLGDAGMGVQMADYVTHAVLRYFRRFDEYESQCRRAVWAPLPLNARAEFSIGVLGAGVLGRRVLGALAPFGFPRLAWNRGPRAIDGVTTYAGMEQLDAFLRATRVLVCMLPLTPETGNLLAHANLAKLPRGAYLVNVARGALVAEADLLALIRSGHLAGATLDVFCNEPLPASHPFWDEPRISITPHIAALTVRGESVQQMARKIGAIERGEAVDDVVDRARGY